VAFCGLNNRRAPQSRWHVRWRCGAARPSSGGVAIARATARDSVEALLAVGPGCASGAVGGRARTGVCHPSRRTSDAVSRACIGRSGRTSWRPRLRLLAVACSRRSFWSRMSRAGRGPWVGSGPSFTHGLSAQRPGRGAESSGGGWRHRDASVRRLMGNPIEGRAPCT
jgi:hypothetical protein